MGKGTPSKGKKNRTPTHMRCRRCGKNAYNMKKAVCASCGFGATAKIRKHSWQISFRCELNVLTGQ